MKFRGREYMVAYVASILQLTFAFSFTFLVKTLNCVSVSIVFIIIFLVNYVNLFYHTLKAKPKSM